MSNESKIASVREDRTVVYPTMAEWQRMLDAIRSNDLVIVDLETSSLDPHTGKIAGAAIRVDGQSYYIPVAHMGLDSRNVPDEAWEEFCAYLNGVPIVNHFVKFDIKFLIAQAGVRPLIRSDTALLAHFVNSDQDLGLKKLSRRWLSTPDRKSFTQVAGKRNRNACKIPIHLIAPYACDDVEEVETLFQMWGPLWEAHPLHRLEIAILEDFINVELFGVRVDLGKLKTLEHEYKEKCEQARLKALAVLGSDVNIDSHAQVAKAFKRIGVELLSKTEGGEDSVARDALSMVDGPGIREYLEYTALAKIFNTYAKGLWKVVKDGIIHPNFKPFHASTGRMSCEAPNLQNQPKKGPIRSCFIAREGYYLAESDLKQVELRILASEAQAPVFIKAFMEGLDLHRVIAGLMLRKPWVDVTDDERDAAKSCNFGVIYGMSAHGLSKRLKISLEEARTLLDIFFSVDPAIYQFIQRMIWQGRYKGIIYTKFGRPRIIPPDGIANTDPKKRAFWEHTCVNTIIQGTAADINKICFHRICEMGKRHGFVPLLTVHDSVLMEVPNALSPAEHEQMVRQAMIFPIDGYVPLDIDYEYGQNWAELRKIHEEQKAIDFAEVRNCSACIIRKEAYAPVPPQQNLNAVVMVVGRNPGRQEDRQGYPFVHEAPAGALLDRILVNLGLDRSQLHVTNVVKCFTTMNRPPTPYECKFCAETWLHREIENIKPKIILTFGNEAMREVTGMGHLSITEAQGTPIQLKHCIVIPLPHPSYLCRNAMEKTMVFDHVLPHVASLLQQFGVHDGSCKKL